MASSSSSSSSVFMSLVFFILGLSCVSMVTAASCASCLIQHPQEKFCRADVVLKVRPKSWQYVGPSGKPVQYGSHAHDVEYQVKVETVFKGEQFLPNKARTIFIYSPKDICNVDMLEIGVRYLISGKLRGDKIEVTTCGLVEKWADLSPAQRRGVRGAYGSQCSECRIIGSNVVRFYGGSEIIDEMSSGLWSKQSCFFNPLASLSYASDDCESRFSYCMRQADGLCAWEGESTYDECFRQREYKWQLMSLDLGQAAWTCPEQCKNLSPRRLKYKCKKATRKLPPCAGRESVRTVNPDAVRELVRTVAPPSANNDIPQPTAVEVGSPQIVNGLSPMLDTEA